MKEEYKLIIFIIIFTVGFLWFRVLLEFFLNQYSTNQTENEFIAEIIVRFFIFTLLFIAVKKLGLNTFNGISRKPYIKNKSVLVVPIFLIVIGLWGNWTTYTNTDTQLFMLFAISVLFVGLVEETCFRGLILPLFINSQIERPYTLYVSVLFSALIFGFLHYLNLFRQPDNFWGITSQVFSGVSMGVFFGALMLRTGNIVLVAVCHGFANFILGNGILEEESVSQIITDSPKDAGIDWVSLLATISIFGLITLIGFNMIRRVDKTEIELELQNLKLKWSDSESHKTDF